MSRNSSSSYNAKANFLSHYNQREQKAERKHHNGGGNIGNFSGTAGGDFRATVYLTHHARQRMAERGVAAKDAIKTTKKSGAVLKSNGAIVTVVPESWAAAKRKMDRTVKSPQKNKPGQRIQNAANPTPYENLPDGQTHKRIDIPSGNTRGHIIGKGGRNLSKLKAEHPGANIELNSNTGVMHVWGNPNQVSSIYTQVDKTVARVKREKDRDIAREEKAKERIKKMQRGEIIKMRKEQKENSKKRQQKEEKNKEVVAKQQQKKILKKQRQKMEPKKRTNTINKEREKKMECLQKY